MGVPDVVCCFAEVLFDVLVLPFVSLVGLGALGLHLLICGLELIKNTEEFKPCRQASALVTRKVLSADTR